MAKNNNLKDFLTDIANAIREKKGTTGAINPQDFSSEIASIESGGGAVVSASISDVNFYDYDGTILHSYTKEQFLALSAMPELPTRDGLICQGWNWTLNDAKEHVADLSKLNIGAMYITDDGDTRLYIRIATEERMNVPLYWSQTVANGVSIDWGDGSAIESFSGTGNKNTTHTYAKHGDYVIRLKVTSGTLGLGGGNISYCIMGLNGNNGRVYCNMLQKVEIGNSVADIRIGAFYNCFSLLSISLPSSVTSIGSRAFYNCYSITFITIPNRVTQISDYVFANSFSIKSIAIPNGVTSINVSAFYICNSLRSVTLPSSVKTINGQAFYNCYALLSVTIPNSVININSSAFYNCQSLASVNIPNGVITISAYAFQNCYAITLISMPSGVTSIKASAFNSCFGMAIYDFTNHTSVPTLENVNAFQNIPSDCVIKVPELLLEEWKAATNWSTYASQIVAG